MSQRSRNIHLEWFNSIPANLLVENRLSHGLRRIDREAISYHSDVLATTTRIQPRAKANFTLLHFNTSNGTSIKVLSLPFEVCHHDSQYTLYVLSRSIYRIGDFVDEASFVSHLHRHFSHSQALCDSSRRHWLFPLQHQCEARNQTEITGEQR
jgi:hypothetical protein